MSRKIVKSKRKDNTERKNNLVGAQIASQTLAITLLRRSKEPRTKNHHSTWIEFNIATMNNTLFCKSRRARLRNVWSLESMRQKTNIRKMSMQVIHWERWVYEAQLLEKNDLRGADGINDHHFRYMHLQICSNKKRLTGQQCIVKTETYTQLLHVF